MKFFIVYFAFLGVCSISTAHPHDNDSFTMLPAGTEFISKRQINIKPGLTTLYFSAGKLLTERKSLQGNKPYCVLSLESSAFDRELTPEKSMLVTTGNPDVIPSSQDTAFNYNDASILVFFNQENNPYRLIGFDQTKQESDRYLYCEKPNGKIISNSYDIQISIGEVKRTLGNYFEIRLPDPSSMAKDRVNQ